MSFSQTVHKHKFITAFVVIFLCFFFAIFAFKFIINVISGLRASSYDYSKERFSSYVEAPQGTSADYLQSASLNYGGVSNSYYPQPVYNESVNLNPSTDRKQLLESTLSLMVKNVEDSLQEAKVKTMELGGFVVSSRMDSQTEYANGILIVRVPSENADEMIKYLKTKAVKVVDENQSGVDITDQYTNVQERIKILNDTKLRFEEIFDKAVTVEEMIRAQNEILNQQSLIDSLMGQQKYMDDASKSVKITAYFSEDEYSLPYSPDDGFNLKTVFKQAVRSLMITLRSLARFVIWVGVFAVIWLPIILLIVIIRRFIVKKIDKEPDNIEASPSQNK